MKDTELMIGDWVAIGENCIMVTSLKECETYLEAKPIPLTAEILKKNGFTDCATTKLDLEHGNTYWYPGEENYISDSEFLINFGERSFLVRYRYSSIFGLRYVHELQHAMRLFGVDKEIVL